MEKKILDKLSQVAKGFGFESKLTKENVGLSLRKGKLEMINIPLSGDSFNKLLPDVDIVKASIGRILVKFSVVRLRSVPIEVHVSDVQFLMRVATGEHWDESHCTLAKRRYCGVLQKALEKRAALAVKYANKKRPVPSPLVLTVMNNAQVHVNRVKIIVVDAVRNPCYFGFSFDQLTVRKGAAERTVGGDKSQEDGKLVRKEMEMAGFQCFIDTDVPVEVVGACREGVPESQIFLHDLLTQCGGNEDNGVVMPADFHISACLNMDKDDVRFPAQKVKISMAKPVVVDMDSKQMESLQAFLTHKKKLKILRFERQYRPAVPYMDGPLRWLQYAMAIHLSRTVHHVPTDTAKLLGMPLFSLTVEDLLGDNSKHRYIRLYTKILDTEGPLPLHGDYSKHFEGLSREEVLDFEKLERSFTIQQIAQFRNAVLTQRGSGGLDDDDFALVSEFEGQVNESQEDETEGSITPRSTRNESVAQVDQAAPRPTLQPSKSRSRLSVFRRAGSEANMQRTEQTEPVRSAAEIANAVSKEIHIGIDTLILTLTANDVAGSSPVATAQIGGVSVGATMLTRGETAILTTLDSMVVLDRDPKMHSDLVKPVLQFIGSDVVWKLNAVLAKEKKALSEWRIDAQSLPAQVVARDTFITRLLAWKTFKVSESTKRLLKSRSKKKRTPLDSLVPVLSASAWAGTLVFGGANIDLITSTPDPQLFTLHDPTTEGDSGDDPQVGGGIGSDNGFAAGRFTESWGTITVPAMRIEGREQGGSPDFQITGLTQTAFLDGKRVENEANAASPHNGVTLLPQQDVLPVSDDSNAIIADGQYVMVGRRRSRLVDEILHTNDQEEGLAQLAGPVQTINPQVSLLRVLSPYDILHIRHQLMRFVTTVKSQSGERAREQQVMDSLRRHRITTTLHSLPSSAHIRRIVYGFGNLLKDQAVMGTSVPVENFLSWLKECFPDHRRVPGRQSPDGHVMDIPGFIMGTLLALRRVRSSRTRSRGQNPAPVPTNGLGRRSKNAVGPTRSTVLPSRAFGSDPDEVVFSLPSVNLMEFNTLSPLLQAGIVSRMRNAFGRIDFANVGNVTFLGMCWGLKLSGVCLTLREAEIILHSLTGGRMVATFDMYDFAVMILTGAVSLSSFEEWDSYGQLRGDAALLEPSDASLARIRAGFSCSIVQADGNRTENRMVWMNRSESSLKWCAHGKGRVSRSPFRLQFSNIKSVQLGLKPMAVAEASMSKSVSPMDQPLSVLLTTYADIRYGVVIDQNRYRESDFLHFASALIYMVHRRNRLCPHRSIMTLHHPSFHQKPQVGQHLRLIVQPRDVLGQPLHPLPPPEALSAYGSTAMRDESDAEEATGSEQLWVRLVDLSKGTVKRNDVEVVWRDERLVSMFQMDRAPDETGSMQPCYSTRYLCTHPGHFVISATLILAPTMLTPNGTDKVPTANGLAVGSPQRVVVDKGVHSGVFLEPDTSSFGCPLPPRPDRRHTLSLTLRDADGVVEDAESRSECKVTATLYPVTLTRPEPVPQRQRRKQKVDTPSHPVLTKGTPAPAPCTVSAAGVSIEVQLVDLGLHYLEVYLAGQQIENSPFLMYTDSQRGPHLRDVLPIHSMRLQEQLALIPSLPNPPTHYDSEFAKESLVHAISSATKAKFDTMVNSSADAIFSTTRSFVNSGPTDAAAAMAPPSPRNVSRNGSFVRNAGTGQRFHVDQSGKIGQCIERPPPKGENMASAVDEESLVDVNGGGTSRRSRAFSEASVLSTTSSAASRTQALTSEQSRLCGIDDGELAALVDLHMPPQSSNATTERRHIRQMQAIVDRLKADIDRRRMALESRETRHGGRPSMTPHAPL